MMTLDVAAILEELLDESGVHGITLAEAQEKHEELKITRPEELRAGLLELVTDGRAEIRGQRQGFSVHVAAGSPQFTIVKNSPRTDSE